MLYHHSTIGTQSDTVNIGVKCGRVSLHESLECSFFLTIICIDLGASLLSQLLLVNVQELNNLANAARVKSPRLAQNLLFTYQSLLSREENTFTPFHVPAFVFKFLGHPSWY